MENNRKKLLKLQADVPAALVKKFRSVCKKRKKFKGAVLERLAEFWLALDESTQDAIYDGKFDNAFKTIAVAHGLSAEEIVAVSEAAGKASRQKRGRSPSKSA